MGKSLTSLGWWGKSSLSVDVRWPPSGVFPVWSGHLLYKFLLRGVGSTYFRGLTAQVSSASAFCSEFLISTPDLWLTFLWTFQLLSPLQVSNSQALRKGIWSQTVLLHWLGTHSNWHFLEEGLCPTVPTRGVYPSRVWEPLPVTFPLWASSVLFSGTTMGQELQVKTLHWRS